MLGKFDDVVSSLEKMQFEITLEDNVRLNAGRAIARMFELTGSSRDNLTLPADVAEE